MLNHCIQLIDMQIDLQISTFLFHYITLQWAFYHIVKNTVNLRRSFQIRHTPTNFNRSSEATMVKRRIRRMPVRQIKLCLWDVFSFKSERFSYNALSSIFLFHRNDPYSPYILVSHRPLMWYWTPIDINVNKSTL